MTKRMKNLLIGVIVGAILVIAGIVTGAVLISNANRKAPTYVSTAAELERAVNDDIDKPIVLKNNIVFSGDWTANKLFDLEMNNYNVIVDGKFTIRTDEAGEMYVGDGKNSLFTREIVKAHQIEIDAVNATVTWNANVTLKDGYTADDFKIAVSDHTFIFNGIIVNGDNEQVDAAMTVSKGRVVLEDNSAGGGTKSARVVVPSGAEKVVIENKAEETAVNIVAEASVAVAGVVAIDVAEGADGVVISTPENNEIPTKINIQSGTADSVNAGGAEITVSEGAVVEGSVTGDKVTNNGSVGGDIVADEVVDNSFAEYKTEKKAELEQYAADKGQNNYSTANWTEIQGYVTSGKTAIDGAADKAAVDSALTAAKEDIDAVKTIAQEEAEELAAYKTEKKAELEQYAANKGQNNYSTANWTKIQGYVTSGKTAIDEAADKAAVDSALTAAKEDIDAVKTIAQEEAEELAAYKTEKKAELEKYAEGKGQSNYYSDNWTEIQGYVTSGKTAIDEAADKAAVDSALTAAKADIDAVETRSSIVTAAKAELSAYVDKNNYYETEQAEVEAAVTAGNGAIEAAESKTEVDNAVAEAKAAIDKVATKSEKLAEAKAVALKAIEEAVAALSSADYSDANWKAITDKAAEAKADIEAVTVDNIAQIDVIKTDALTAIDEVKTIAEELEAYKTEKKNALDGILSALVEADYYAAEWSDIQGYVTSGKTAIDEAADTAAVDKAIADAEAAINAVEKKADVIEKANSELKAYADEKGEGNYTAADWLKIASYIEDAAEEITAADSKEKVAEAVAAAKTAIDGVELAPVRIEGKIGYAALKEAIEAAETGDVIRIYADIKEDEGNIKYQITKAITIEGVIDNGKKPVVYGGFSIVIKGVSDGSDVAVIKNLEIVHNGVYNADPTKDTKGAIVVGDGGLTLTGNYIHLIDPAPANVSNSPSGLQLSRAADSVSTAKFVVEGNTFGAYPQYSDATKTIATAIQVTTNYVSGGKLVYGYIELDDEAIYKANVFENTEGLDQYILYGNYNWSVRDDGTPVGYKYVVFGSIFAYNRDGGDGIEGGTVAIAGDITLTDKAYSIKSNSEFIVEDGVVFDGNGLVLDVYGKATVRGEIRNVTLVKHPGAQIAAEEDGVIADSVTVVEVGADTVVLSSDDISSDTVFDSEKNYIVNFTEVNTTVLKLALAAQVKSMTVNLIAGTYSVVEQMDIVSPAVINGNGAVFNVTNSAADNTAFNVAAVSAEFHDITINGDKNNRVAIAIAYNGASSVIADGVDINMSAEAKNIRGIAYMGDDATGASLKVTDSNIYLGEDYENIWYNSAGDDSRGISLFDFENGKLDVVNSNIKGFKYVINVTGKSLEDGLGNPYYYGACSINVSNTQLYGWTGFNIWSSGVKIALTDESVVRGIQTQKGPTNDFSAITFNADLYKQFDLTVIKNSKLTIDNSTVSVFVSDVSAENGNRETFIRVDGDYGFDLTLNNAKFVDESGHEFAILDSGTNDNAFLAEIEAAVKLAGGSYTVYNADGEVIEMPLAPVSVNENLIADATEAAESIGGVYNKYVNKGELTVEQIKADYPSFEFYVKLGKTAFENTVLTLGGTAYYASDEIKLSIGNNTFVKAPVWYYDDAESVVYVSAVALAAETYTTSSRVVFTGYSYVIEGEMPDILSVTPAVKGNGGSLIENVTDIQVGKRFDYTLKNGTDAFVLSYDNAAQDDMIVTKKVITSADGVKTVSYGFTYPDAVNGGFGLMYYPKYGATFEDNGTFELDYSFYVVGKGVSINKVSVTVDIRDIYVSSAADIKDAFANAKDGDTIILSDDIVAAEGDAFLTLRADAGDLDVTLDLNEHRLDYRLDLRSTTVDNKESGSKLTVKIENGAIGSDTGYNAVGGEIAYGMLIAGGNVDLTLNKVTAYGVYGGIYENGSWKGSVVNATDCSFIGVSGGGAYLPGGHTSTFTDCEFIGTLGAYIKSGNKTFNNCTIRATGEYIAPSYNGNGSDGDGSGIVVDSTVGYNQPMSVTVNGGTIESKNGYAIEEVSNAKEGVEEVCYSEVVVTGGAKLSGGKGEVYSENGVVTINTDNGAVMPVSTETALKNALANVSIGGTVVLTNDIAPENGQVVAHSASGERNFTLDINGHNLVAELYLMGAEIKDNKVWTYDYAMTATVIDSSAEEGKTGKGSIGDSTTKCYYGIIPQGQENLTVTIKNVNALGYWGGIHTNGMYEGATVTAEYCTFTGYCEVLDDAGLGGYLAANHTVVFNGCMFVGPVGIYIKSGDTTFNNCVINGEGEYFDPIYNGSGTSGSGSGIVIDSTVGYKQPMKVTVNGGEIASVYGYAVEEVSNAKAGVDKVCYATVNIGSDVKLTAGALGTVRSENGVVGGVDEVYTSTSEGIENAIANGVSEIVLNGDIDGLNLVIENSDVTIDLNGKKVTAETGFAFVVNGGSLTVNGTGTVRVNGGSANDNVFYAENGGTITVNGGDFSVGADKDGLGNSCVYADGGTVIINGGTFATDAAYNNFYYVLNIKNGTQSPIIVNGGTFVNYNPETGDDADGGNFVAEGYKVISEEKGGKIYYTVVADDFDDEAIVVTEDGTLADSIANAADGAIIRLGADMTVDSAITIDKNIVLDLNGYAIDSTADGARAFTVTSGKLTVKNGTVTSNGSGTNQDDAAGSYGAVRVEGGELVMYDVTLENSRPWGAAVKMVGGKAIFRNVTINSVYGGGVEVGGVDGGSAATADFYECKFTQTEEYLYCSNLISVCYGGTANIHSGNYKGVYGLYVYNSGGTINVYGGKIIGQKESVHIDAVAGKVSSVNVESGSLTGNVTLAQPGSVSLLPRPESFLTARRLRRIIRLKKPVPLPKAFKNSGI